MEKFKDLVRIKKMLDKGEITCLDIESGYRYSLCAVCQNDANECSVSSFERNIGAKSKITRVFFYCPICGTEFDVFPENMFLR
jgi:hypothetical protein